MEKLKNITFENINQPGRVVYENDLYFQIQDPEMLQMYDYNYIQFKKIPSLVEFKEAAHYLRAYHLINGQNHVKFYFPSNKKLTTELKDYFNESYYCFSYLELYVIQPNQFPTVNDDSEIDIQRVSNESLDTYLKFQYEKDLENGPDFADQKRRMNIRNFQVEKIMQLIAYYKGIPAGTVDIYIQAETAEIDSLFVHKSFQKKGIGSRLQKFVMNEFFEKIVILVADGEDTPREMYRKQKYQYLGFKYVVMKVN